MTRKNLCLIILPRIVLWLFIFFNIIAILCYPGSTYHDHLSPGYSFMKNFLSDLGRTISFSGEINFLSSQLFNTSLILAGGIFTVFYFHVRKVFSVENLQIPTFVGSSFGILGGFSLIGVGLTPADLFLDLHVICATWLFRFFFIASLCFSWVIFRHTKFDNKYALGYIVFTISILLYIFVSEFGPSPKLSQFTLIFQVVSQKIIFLIFLISIFLQTMGLKKLNI